MLDAKLGCSTCIMALRVGLEAVKVACSYVLLFMRKRMCFGSCHIVSLGEFSRNVKESFKCANPVVVPITRSK